MNMIEAQFIYGARMKIIGGFSENTQEFVELPEPISAKPPRTSWITREEAAQIAEKSIKTIDRLRKEGILKDVVMGRRIFIIKESLEDYIRRPLQPISDDNKMMIISCTQYDGMKRKIQHAEATEAQLSSAEQRLVELQAQYDDVAGTVKDTSSKSWYQRLFSGYLFKNRMCRSQNPVNLDWGLSI